MVSAYIMVKANTGEADRLREQIGQLDGVQNVHIVAGDVDLITKIDVDSPSEVKDIVATGIQGIRGVEDTRTYITMD